MLITHSVQVLLGVKFCIRTHTDDCHSAPCSAFCKIWPTIFPSKRSSLFFNHSSLGLKVILGYQDHRLQKFYEV